MIWILLCCTGPDSKESTAGEDTALQPEAHSLSTAQTIVQGIENEAAGASLGFGDFNGDQKADLVISAYAGGPTCIFAGPPPRGLVPIVSGSCFAPAGPYDFAGIALGTAGDTDGDGREELLIGAIGAGTGGTGIVYVVDGNGGNLADALYYSGEANLDYAGSAVATAGDTDGDGREDILIGASNSTTGGAGAGKAYLLYGPLAGGSLLDAPVQFVGAGANAVRHATPGGGDGVGYALAGVGDTNGDGFDDVLIGAAGNDSTDTDAGKACLFLGPVAAGSHLLTEADAVFTGPEASAFAGDRVAPAGDTNSDGYADMLISADGEKSQAGTVYLWRGPAKGGLSLNYAPLAWDGEKEGDQAGYAVASNADVNGDGLTDVAIGAWARDGVGEDAGRTYLVLSPYTDGRFTLGEGAYFDGEVAGDYSGRALAMGDVDGDGHAEVFVGAPFASKDGLAAGRGYLLGF